MKSTSPCSSSLLRTPLSRLSSNEELHAATAAPLRAKAAVFLSRHGRRNVPATPLLGYKAPPDVVAGHLACDKRCRRARAVH